jgi:hypothetical protein
VKSSAFYAVIGLGAILVAAVLWYGLHEHQPRTASVSSNTTSTDTASGPSLAGLSIYTNGQYGFSFVYPGTDKTETEFDMQYHLPATWRVNALTDASGTPVIAVIGYSTKSNSSYPRYFETEVRVGVSADPKEVAACEKVSDGETARLDVVLNKVMWKAFALGQVGMSQYMSGVSYRKVHNNMCFAVEQIQTGSSYRDQTPTAADIPDTVLSEKFDALNTIVQSFSFAKP